MTKKFIVALLLLPSFLSLGAVLPADGISPCGRVPRSNELLEQLKATGEQGTKGRLVIKDFSVALYECGEDGVPNAVEVVDAYDSAAWFMWCESESPIIADHCTQGFDIIKDCAVGDICYIVQGDNYQAYECVAIDPNGINKRTDLLLSTGQSFMRKNEPGFLYMYTCTVAGNYRNITVAIWKPTDS